VPYTNNAQAPAAQANVAASKEGQLVSGDETTVDAKPVCPSPATAHANSPVESAAVPEQE
jgi:hypothetical protein